MQGLYFITMGRAFKVIAIFFDDDVANKYMESNPGAAVIDASDGMIILADKNDEGTKLHG